MKQSHNCNSTSCIVAPWHFSRDLIQHNIEN